MNERKRERERERERELCNACGTRYFQRENRATFLRVLFVLVRVLFFLYVFVEHFCLLKLRFNIRFTRIL